MKRDMLLKSMASGSKNHWTLEQQKYLLANHKSMYIDDIAQALGRSTKATKDKAFRMGCSIKSKVIK